MNKTMKNSVARISESNAIECSVIRTLDYDELDLVAGGLNWDQAIMRGFTAGGALGSIIGTGITGSSTGFRLGGILGATLGGSFGIGYGFGTILSNRLNNP